MARAKGPTADDAMEPALAPDGGGLIGGIVTPLGALSADDPLAGGLFVVYFAAAVALADRDVSPWA